MKGRAAFRRPLDLIFIELRDEASPCRPNEAPNSTRSLEAEGERGETDPEGKGSTALKGEGAAEVLEAWAGNVLYIKE